MIPKIIHYCWFGGGDLPEKDKNNIEQWKKMCPDFEIKRWDESNYDVKKNNYMYQAYCNKKLGFVTDYARLDIIYEYGGFYFDTDVEIVKNLDVLVNEKCVMGFESEKQINHGHGFAAEPHNETIKSLRDTYDSLSFVKDDGSLNLIASPKYISDFMRERGVIMNNKEQRVGDVLVLPTEYFCPKNIFTGKVLKTSKTISIHHFNMSWMDDVELKKMAKIKRLSKYIGKTFAYNIIEFQYNAKEKGLKYATQFIYKKIKNKRGK